VREFEIILGLVLVASIAQPIARRFDIPVAIAQVVCGLLLSAIPFVSQVRLDPDLTFTLFVPPLLFWAATTGSVRDVRRNARPILLLATALVLVTTAAVAVVAHAVAPDIPWAAAFVLGAIVAPPDADVTTSVARRLGVPSRVVTILEGETLLNDTTAFVTYRLAVRATVIGGVFSFREAAVRFVLITVGGIAVGLAIGWLLGRSLRLRADPVAEVAFSLVTPFAAYLAAESVGGSGVLSVVTAGFYLSRFAPRDVSAGTRIYARNTWEVVTFCIGAVVFTLIGVQLGRLVPTLASEGDIALFRLALLVTGTVIGARMIWVFLTAWLPGLARRYRGVRDALPSWRRLTVVSWAGLRGGDTLVMLLAVPFTTQSGAPFPARDTIIAVAFFVLVFTLVMQGLTLRPLIKRLAIPRDAVVEEEERRARLEATQASLARLQTLAEQEHLPRRIVSYLRSTIHLRTKLDLDDIEHGDRHDGRTAEDVVRRVEQDVREAARRAIVRLRDDDVIGQEALRRVLKDLDLDEIRDQ
jgi:monovalent cation/hydrogen antiporter